MTRNADHELARLARRAWLALACGGFTTALTWIAAGGGATLIALRMFGERLEPTSLWALAAVPALAWGVFRAVREAPGRSGLATAIDRRFGLGGLFVTGLEVPNAAWRAELDARLGDSSARLPRLRPWRWLSQCALAVAFPLGVAALQGDDPIGARESRAIELALEDVTEKIELALEDGVVSEARGEELEQRARDLARMLEDGEQVSWGDVDALAERLSHEQSSHVGGLRALHAGLREFDELAAQSRNERLAHDRLAELWQRAADLGLLEDILEDLPADVRAELEAAARRQGTGSAGLDTPGGLADLLGKLDPTQLGLDAATLERLRDGACENAGAKLGGLAEKGRLAKSDLHDLRDLLEGEGLLDRQQDGARSNAPGRGGVDRGRGDADLDYLHDTDADTSGLSPAKLPPGVAVPDEWQVAGVSRAVPFADPREAAPGSGDGVAGQGRATWHRRLAPRHRDAVRRFFSGAEGR